ncbi:hypothetical protein F8O01_10740 [Pseudoclavibacter chungangensis]|uniref:Uncharacterized protein n=1 Tax=Pseudoclavibacter chungangensis TaxID=587635 RepID=A0A7J5BRG7_9MICO|nr:hypothetical protein [Pseudoclavibacter chungangensis]KAB1656335.1 hypothetical protein F8O01_10740 [Pseudoclavibacter chungangensis]NYJ67104.1 hypothetical protein [Pseudoclavibacter chungangensis]
MNDTIDRQGAARDENECATIVQDEVWCLVRPGRASRDEAVALLEDGARVGIIADDVEPLATLVAVYYDRILPVETNVRDTDAVERGIALAREHFGWIDRLRTP